jgi:DNA (cytosine-5)-methyltransferase 1
MNYYNDNDPKACAWLRELIAAGEIAAGHVDERSILEIKPDDLAGFDQCHFFAGIGGWPLALRWAGLGDAAGIWTGSCPCQPLSCAGQRKGHADERHLWPAFHDLIAKRRPATVFGEQVASKDGREWFAGVRLDLEDLGYACGGADLCAAGVGSPHRRQRLFWVADADGRNEGHGRLQRGREHGQRTPDGGVVRVAHAEHAERRPVESEHERNWDAEREEAASGLGTCGEANGMGHATSNGREVRDGVHAELRGQGFGEGCESVRLGYSASRGCGERGDAAQPGRGGHPDRAGWARCDILPCRDGKARRVEAGTFPLADGIPGRMGLLRGYGNAIVPQVAEVFVRAWMDCRANSVLDRSVPSNTTKEQP